MAVLTSRSVAYSNGRGEFFCPTCRQKRPYKCKCVRRFICLCWIPVFPLHKVGQYTECEICHGTFRGTAPTGSAGLSCEQMRPEFHGGVRTVMVQMLLADGKVDEREIELIQRMSEQITGSRFSRRDINADISRLNGRPEDLGQYLTGLAKSLNTHGKELIIKAAFFVATADGEFEDNERAFLKKLAQALDVPNLDELVNSLLLDQLCDPGDVKG